MKCDQCPVRDGLSCLGENHRPVCRNVAEGQPGRAEQLVAIAEGRPIDDAADQPDDVKARLAMVNACPDRGGVLPLSMQDDCGCQSRERSECRAGKGAIPGRVTLRDCLACVGGGP